MSKANGKQHVLKSKRIKLEQHLQCSRDTRRLYLAPQSAPIAPYAVHDARDIPEMFLELILEHVRILATEENCFVKAPRPTSDVNDLRKTLVGLRVVFVSARCTVIVGREVRAETRDGAQEEDGIEIDVLETLGVCGDARDEAL